MWCDLEYLIIIAFLNITRSLEYVRCFLVLEVRRSVLKAMLVKTFERSEKLFSGIGVLTNCLTCNNLRFLCYVTQHLTTQKSKKKTNPTDQKKNLKIELKKSNY